MVGVSVRKFVSQLEFFLFFIQLSFIDFQNYILHYTLKLRIHYQIVYNVLFEYL